MLNYHKFKIGVTAATHWSWYFRCCCVPFQHDFTKYWYIINFSLQ
jgi:hypothetical protein